MTFSEIPGLQELKHQLIGAHNKNHIAHAQLFNSNEGGAGLPLALAYTTYLLCENKQDEDACGKCPACIKMSKYIHPDVHFFFPKPSKEVKKEGEENRTIANFREFLTESPFGTLSDWIIKSGTETRQNVISKEDALRIIKTVSMKSFEGGLKILIIWCPEYMNSSSANAILKVLEEPPTSTIYILVTHQYEKLLGTILSRTQHVLIPRMSAKDVSQYLVSHYDAPQENARKSASLADGNMSIAISALNNGHTDEHVEFQEWMRECFRAKFDLLVKRSEEFNKQGKNAQRNFFEYAILQLRNSMVYQTVPKNVAMNEDETNFASKFGSSITGEQFEKLYRELNVTLQQLERNANPRITFLAVSNRIAGIFNQV